MAHSLKFGSSEQWRSAMTLAVEIADSLQSIAHFPSVSITPNWSVGRVEIKIPIGTPLYAERMADLQEACRFHGCEYVIMTHHPGGEFFREPYIIVRVEGEN